MILGGWEVEREERSEGLQDCVYVHVCGCRGGGETVIYVMH